ncbi:MAG: serine protease, partial [Planctomycetota bacterium]
VMSSLRLAPELPAVKSSMGACLLALGDNEKGIEFMWEAAQTSQSELIVGNLLYAIDSVPRRWIQANRKLREINIAADPLRNRFASNGALLWIEDYTYGTDRADPDAPDAGPPGLRGNGSGFFVTADGYLITNRHVAETDDGFYYRIRLSIDDEDGVPIEYPARFIASDDEYDIALLKIELPEGETVEYFHLLQEDVPPIQSDVMTAGYPTVGTGEFVFQTARGTVSSNDTDDENFDIYLDMKTTQGNSGGPIFDRNGHVIGITTAYRKVYDSIVSLAVGPRQIRDFLSDVDEAPVLDYDSETDRDFSPVELAAEVQPKTVLVLIFADELESDDEDDEDGDELESDDEDDEDGDEREEEDDGPSGPGGGFSPEDGIQ